VTSHADGPCEPEPLQDWRDHGFTVADARRWISANFAIDEAERWRYAGVYNGREAREWRTAGSSPYNVERWLRAGMTPRESVRWREFGFSADEAVHRHLAGERPGMRKRWWRRTQPALVTNRDIPIDAAELQALRTLLREGIPVALARTFVDLKWDGAQAVSWARREIDPASARLFQALGFTPDEAKRALAAGSAIELMKAWWRAGVPLDEMATWFGAGYTPERASDERSSRESVEQAEILRALTDGEL
jgi:hypothetical protein